MCKNEGSRSPSLFERVLEMGICASYFVCLSVVIRPITHLINAGAQNSFVRVGFRVCTPCCFSLCFIQLVGKWRRYRMFISLTPSYEYYRLLHSELFQITNGRG